jgi:hypothetical protein
MFKDTNLIIINYYEVMKTMFTNNASRLKKKSIHLNYEDYLTDSTLTLLMQLQLSVLS